MMSTNPFRPGGKDDAHQGSGPRNAVANAGSSETTRQTFTSHVNRPKHKHPEVTKAGEGMGVGQVSDPGKPRSRAGL
jgi:hypothetical protein